MQSKQKEERKRSMAATQVLVPLNSDKSTLHRYINVSVRVKPITEKEKQLQKGRPSQWIVKNDKTIMDRNGGDKQAFTFDHVFE